MTNATILMKALSAAMLFVVFTGCGARSGGTVSRAEPTLTGIQEASGVVRRGNQLLIVGDEDAGTYYLYTLPEEEGPAYRLTPESLEKVVWRDVHLAIDQESIEVLADGRVVILSERLRGLFAEEGVVSEYHGKLSDFGNRGLEGVAVREMLNGHSRVAVLWEGGYPVFGMVPGEIRDDVGRTSLSPVIVVHDLDPDVVGQGVFRPGTHDEIRLRVPNPPGEEPQAQRFRAPDFVWHEINSGDSESWGFIVLLSSGYSLPPAPGSPEDCGSDSESRPIRYCFKWLQQFDREGRPVGKPLDLDKVFPPELAGENWEGMDWFEAGRSLVLVHEADADETGVAFVVELPENWR